MKELVILSKKSILFLCTGNSCRSQIAEGFGKRYLTDYIISSAGTEAHGMNPDAIKTMEDIGIDISNQKSEKINLSDLNSFDLIITLCGDANDKCLTFDKNIKHIHWDIKDPAKLTGNSTQISKGFSKIRDEILEKIKKIKESI
mgnify:CR=1 FL=1